MNIRIRNRIISVLVGIIVVWGLVTLVNWQGVMRRALLATAILSMPAGELSAIEGAVSGNEIGRAHV